MQSITILGSTGTIGQNSLSVIAAHPDQFKLFALTANANVELLLSQCLQFKPKFCVLKDMRAANKLNQKIKDLHLPTKVLAGEKEILTVAEHSSVDTVIAGIVGAAGLLPTFAAVRAGKRVLLANKESLVMSGNLLMEAVVQNKSTLLPVDSEHNAIFQCLHSHDQAESSTLRRIILTASGGAFLHLPLNEFDKITPEQACQHPNWVMGPKITVDSATMMNKGFEVIEAHYLFKLPVQKIEIVIHPQSIIHGMVEYSDGSILAQLGFPDMRTPIACALAWPKRLSIDVKRIDFSTLAKLEFSAVSEERYPCLSLAYQALKAGGNMPTVLNAANEVAVAAFLAKEITFLQIGDVVKDALGKIPYSPVNSIDDVMSVDQEVRRIVKNGNYSSP